MHLYKAPCNLLTGFGDVSNNYASMYCKSGNFHVKIIHVLNIHFDLFSWVYGTHENILT